MKKRAVIYQNKINMKNFSLFLFLLSLSVIISIIVIIGLPLFNLIDFPSFPIKGLRTGLEQPIASFDCTDCSERFPLSPPLRIVLSVIFYGLLLAIPASVPLFIVRRFKSTSFYLMYKKFWLLSGIIFSVVFTILIGETPNNLDPIFYPYEVMRHLISLAFLSAIVWCLTILPASIQHQGLMAVSRTPVGRQ